MMNVYMGSDVEEFIFGEGTTYEEAYEGIEEDLNEFGIIECFDDPDAACYRIALENEQNYNAIMMAMANHEIDVLEATGTAVVYEAGKLEAFKDKLKEQIQKFWAKVKGVFKKVMDTISSFVLSNKAFVNKYKKDAAKFKAKDPKKQFTGYKFGDLEIKYSAVPGVIERAMNAGGIEDSESSSKTIKAAVADVLCGKAVSKENFQKVLKEKLYGSDTQVYVPLRGFSELLDDLATAKDSKKAAKAAYAESEKAVKGLLGEVKSIKAETEAEAKHIKTLSSGINTALSLMSTALSVQTKAMVAKCHQDRAMANYYVRGQKIQEAASETEFELDIQLI